MATRSRRPSQARRRSGSSARGASSSVGGALIAGLAALVLLVVAVIGLGGCGDDASTAGSPSATGSGSGTPAASAEATRKPAKTPKPTAAVDPTAVPGDATDEPTPEPTRSSTTTTDWGEILDGVPVTFPVYPGAETADPPDGPASAAWLVAASPRKVSAWYVTQLEAQGYSTINLADPLEDGTIVLDSGSDVPECRVQTVFRPVDGTTLITVLYGSGCNPALD